MKSKQEILDHLSKTVYTHNARKSIVEWLLQHNVISNKTGVKFAGHVYNRDGVMMTKGLSFEDFDDWLGGHEIDKVENLTYEKLKDFLWGLNRKVEYRICAFPNEMTKKSAKELCDAWKKCDEIYPKDGMSQMTKWGAEDFQVGDAVKYIPSPDKNSTEYVEAIASGSNGETYLCLSNGEYVKTCYCLKYKIQGDERRELIDKLNEVL